MGLLSGLVTWPLAPVRGVVWIADQVLQEAERQYYDPARIRAELDEIDQLRREGSIDAEEADDREEELIARLMHDDRRR